MNEWDDETSVALPPEAADDEEAERNRAYLIVIQGSSVGEMFKIDRDAMIVGRSVEAPIRLLDDGISRKHCRLLCSTDEVVVEDLDSRNGTFCNGERIRRRILHDGDKLQLGTTTILKFTFHDQLDESFQRQMLDSALRDGLTGAYNKRYFMDRLDSEMRFAVRHKVSLSLLLLDLDHFKQVNDTYGHLAGDRVLSTFASVMTRTIRNEDVLARYGGEEFAIITRQISRHHALRFGERLRHEVEALRVDLDSRVIRITVSVGIATLPENAAKTPEELIEIADRALYRAKEQGRNRVLLSELDD